MLKSFLIIELWIEIKGKFKIQALKQIQTIKR